MTTSSLIMASQDSSASLDVPLVATFRSENTSRNNSSPSKMKAILGALVAISLTVLLLHQRCESKSEPLELLQWNNTVGVSDANDAYGMDVSWPIHRPIRRTAPSIFGQGARHQAYVQHLKGCRAYYAQKSKATSRLCDAYEFDRMLMNKRQPQSMQVRFDSK